MRTQDLEKKSLPNLISHQSDIDKIYLYAKDLYEANYQLLINKEENLGLKYFNDFKNWIFRHWNIYLNIKYSNDMHDIYKNIEEYNPNKKRLNIDSIWWYGCWYVK